MTDSKYFTTTKKGEIFELKSELNSDKKEKKREAVKKVSAKLNFYLYVIDYYGFSENKCVFFQNFLITLQSFAELKFFIFKNG